MLLIVCGRLFLANAIGDAGQAVQKNFDFIVERFAPDLVKIQQLLHDFAHLE